MARARSRFGWVATAEPFTLEDFAQEYVPHAMGSPLFLGALEKLLDSIAHIEPDKPVACEYVRRATDRIEHQEAGLDVHRVFFYPE